MKYWLQDLLTHLTSATSPEQLFDAVAREARGLGGLTIAHLGFNCACRAQKF